MKHSYNLAKSLFPQTLISKHWNIYSPEFKELLFNRNKLEHFRSNELSYKLNDSLEKGMFSRTKRVLSKLSNITGHSFIDKNKEVVVGRPISFRINDKFYDYHDLFLIYFFHTLLPFLCEQNKKNSFFICEIGGGYGGLMYRIKRNFPKATCILFDLPEQNYISNYYLKKLDRNAKILNLEILVKNKKVNNADSIKITKDDLLKYDYVILPGYLIKNFEENFINIFINTRSFMEMTIDTINYYFLHIHRLINDNGLFYCVNRYQKKTSGDVVKFKCLPFDKKWKFELSRKSFQQPLIHEGLLRRDNKDNDYLKKELSKLRPYDIEFFRSLI